MIARIIKTLNLLPKRERLIIVFLSTLRAFLGLLDLAGTFLIGVLLAYVAGQYTSGENSKSMLSLEFIFNNITLSQLSVIILFLFISKSLLASLLMKIMSEKFANAEANIATTLFSNFLFEPVSELNRRSKSEYVHSLTYAASFGITNLLNASVIISSEVFLLLTITLLFAIINLPMTIFIFVYFLLIGYLIQRTIGTLVHAEGKKSSNTSINSSTAVSDAIVAFREISALNKQREFIYKFKQNREALAHANAKIEFLFGLPRYIVETGLMIGAIVLAIFIFRSSDFAAAAGTLGIFLTGSLRIMASMLPLQSALSNFKQFSAKADSFYELIDDYYFKPNRLPNTFKSENLSEVHEPIGIELKKVSYLYHSELTPAVQDVSIKIEPGQLVALIGPSGSGKSTLADLIIGLISPTEGVVELDNSGHRNFGYVPQSPGMISGTILQNITFNLVSDDYDKTRMEFALNVSHLSSLINTLPDGLLTNLGAQSDSLSGGQLQRIGLARALYGNPGLLILDEATSALDAETESAISESLQQLRGQCTIIVIAHRLSTVQNADIVYLLDQGRIADKGKFFELAKSNELVSRFVELAEIKSH